MTDAAVQALAHAAGLGLRYTDAFGVVRDVSPDTLRAVLAALDLPAATEAQAADSLARARRDAAVALPPLLTATAAAPAHIAPGGRFSLVLEDGTRHEGHAGTDGALPAVGVPGYHRLELDDGIHTLAVAPPRCVVPADVGAARAWGLAVQLYSLCRSGDFGLGDFAALRDFVASAGRHGAACVAISPVHAQFSADADRFSPYAPSSRCLLNIAHAACDGPEPATDEPLVDWPRAVRARLACLRDMFGATGQDAAFRAWRAAQGRLLEDHARFEALHAQAFGADPAHWNWRTWPAAWQDPASPAVAAFAAEHAREVDFHAWLQWRADADLAAAQAAARQAGMPIGLISDLAVGTDAGGSHAWSRQDETLIGLSIGAPPDLLNLRGQDWGLVAFSPTGLRRQGYRAFIEMLRAALRHAGGVRIDHAMGLARLWVLPQGAPATEGAYLHFPLGDLLRLVALESWRHRAIVLGEDLGTVPEGFQDRLADAGVLGLRVLPFERTPDERFKPPADWTQAAAAMTSTHDIATLAGWWSGRDIGWRADLGLLGDREAEETLRRRDRTWLWQAMQESGAAAGGEPGAWDTWPVIDAAIAHLGHSACDLMLLPVEDALAVQEQPNLPGTLHEHPNWRRRIPGPAASILDAPEVAARLSRLDRIRPRGRNAQAGTGDLSPP